MSNFENALRKIAAVNPSLSNTLRSRGGFIMESELPELERVDRLMLLLVRCGCGRFMAPVQDVKHFTTIIAEHSKLKQAEAGEEYAGDYVRDVSLPA
jgi:hypothetical protein